jgi:hypothetical protein
MGAVKVGETATTEKGAPRLGSLTMENTCNTFMRRNIYKYKLAFRYLQIDAHVYY